MYKKSRLIFILPVMLLLAVLVLTKPASAQEASCQGCTSGTFSGSPACLKDGNLHICPVNFPDANFQNYVTNTLNGGKDIMTTSSAKKVFKVDIEGLAVGNMKGIEYFTELIGLYADIRNHYTELDLSKNTDLRNLRCSGNLTELDLSNNTKLESLSCSNTKITTLDLSKNTRLESISCGTSKISAITINSEYLTYLFIPHNNLKELDLSKCPNLETLYCGNNQLSHLNLEHTPKLKVLDFSFNTLINLDLSYVPELESLKCNDNYLTELSLTSNLKIVGIDCCRNIISNLELSHLSKLISLKCSGNQLTSLLLPENSPIYNIECDRNLLKSLDLTGAPELMHLNCENNNLSYVDLTNNSKLLSAKIGNQHIDDFTINVVPGADNTSTKIDLTQILSQLKYQNVTVSPIAGAVYNSKTNILSLPNYSATQVNIIATMPYTSDTIFEVPQISIIVNLVWPHIWSPATCLSPERCTFCGETRGEVTEHNWLPPTKSQPNVCSYCGLKSGHPLEHVYKSATCTRPATCLYCDATQGEALPHKWSEATCTTYARCKICNKLSDSGFAHVWYETSGCTTQPTCKLCHKRGPSLYDDHDWEGPTLFSHRRCRRCGYFGGYSYFRQALLPIVLTLSAILLILPIAYLAFVKKWSKNPATTFWYLFTRDKHQDEMQK